MRLFTELIMKIITLIISAGETTAIPIFNIVFIVKSPIAGCVKDVETDRSSVSDYSLELKDCQVL